MSHDRNMKHLPSFAVTLHVFLPSSPVTLLVLLRSQTNAKISLPFKRDFENNHSKLRILVDSRLENQRIWCFVLITTISLLSPFLCFHSACISLNLLVPLPSQIADGKGVDTTGMDAIDRYTMSGSALAAGR